MSSIALSTDGSFRPTRWTLVWRARGEGKEAFRALSELCAIYHYPLYCFARRQGLGPQDAEDATQDFFASLIEKDFFARADATLGRLRSFLLTAYQRSLHRRWKSETCQKRNRLATVPLDGNGGEEERYRKEPETTDTPETLYHRAWAIQLLATSLARVEAAWCAGGKSAAFTALTPFLSGAWHTSDNFSDTAAALGITVNAARHRACQLRRDYREALLAEIAETIASHDPAALEEELRFLYRAVG